MILGAAVRNSADTALYPSVKLRGAGYEETGGRVQVAGALHIVGRVPIPGVVVALMLGAKEAHTQTQIEGQAVGGVPVVLEVRFENLVAVVGLDRSFLLFELGDASCQ